MLKRKNCIKEYLNEFIPSVISNLVCEYDYYYLEGKCELTLQGHRKTITCCTILTDDHLGCSAWQAERVERIVSGSADKTLRIWNIETGKCELILEGHTSYVRCCAILLDKRIISAMIVPIIHLRWHASSMATLSL